MPAFRRADDGEPEAGDESADAPPVEPDGDPAGIPTSGEDEYVPA